MLRRTLNVRKRRRMAGAAKLIATLLTLGGAVYPAASVWGQKQSAPAALASARRVASPFDLSPREGEHPLEPLVRVLKDVRDHIDQNVRDYSCTLTKQERIDGELGEKQHIFIKVRNEPFSVYMRFLEPHTNREVIYAAGQNNGNLIALDCGWKRRLGAIPLDPEGMIAMRGQKYPITRVGVRNLVDEYIRLASKDVKYAECNVTSDPNTVVNGRSATLIQVTHPQPRREFRGYVIRLFLDNEMRIPVYYDSYDWPTKPGGAPPLEESYMYSNVQINNGFTNRDFDKNNPSIFKAKPDS